MGAWILEELRGQWRVIKSAPFPFLVFIVLGCFLGYGASYWYFSKQITDKEGQIGRYRLALGIDPGGKGVLIELTNIELQAKAINIAAKLNDMCSVYKRKIENTQRDFSAGKISDKTEADIVTEIDRDMGDQFIRTLRADSLNVDNELRRRLGPQAVAAIVGITPSMVDANGNRVDISTLLFSMGNSPGFNMTFTCALASGIEQMAKLLPPDSPKP